MSFPYKNVETIGIYKNEFQLTSFSYIGRIQNFTSRANDFLLHADRRTDGHTFTPLYTNVIVPSYLRYVGLIIHLLMVYEYATLLFTERL